MTDKDILEIAYDRLMSTAKTLEITAAAITVDNEALAAYLRTEARSLRLFASDVVMNRLMGAGESAPEHGATIVQFREADTI